MKTSALGTDHQTALMILDKRLEAISRWPASTPDNKNEKLKGN